MILDSHKMKTSSVLPLSMIKKIIIVFWPNFRGQPDSTGGPAVNIRAHGPPLNSNPDYKYYWGVQFFWGKCTTQYKFTLCHNYFNLLYAITTSIYFMP